MASRNELRGIARRAMTEHGRLPDFSPAVVRIFKPVVEGKVVHGFDGLDVGDRVRVKLIRTDVERGFIDFVRVREAR